uniref:Uncharacterized protein n=1 Tax=Arundo donax TaxID=35708 RepID=A0A0A9ESE7_ARUDO
MKKTCFNAGSSYETALMVFLACSLFYLFFLYYSNFIYFFIIECRPSYLIDCLFP